MTKELNWREQMSVVGKRTFELRQMLNLGFIDKAELESKALDIAEFESIYDLKIANVQEIRATNQLLTELGDVAPIIEKVRKSRIARIKNLRVIREAEKELSEQEKLKVLRERKLREPFFLGHGVSDQLKFTEPDLAKLELLGLPVLRNLHDIYKLIGLNPETIVWLCFEKKVSSVDHYLRFEIPKRSGGMRLISSPKKQMRQAQLAIREDILKKMKPSEQAMAFRPDTSIVDNAKAHLGAKILVRVDLKDFFPSISFNRVRGFFKSCGYSPGVATVLALLTTDAQRVYVKTDTGLKTVARGKRGLPQGACTSPDLANLIAKKLDARLQGLVQYKGEWRYTRYADDLVFSTLNKDSDAFGIVKAVEKIAIAEGFAVNQKKTSIKRPSGRMSVTGLVINEDGVRLSKSDLKKIRAFLHKCDTLGREEVSREIGKSANAVAKGYISYLHMVSPELAQKYRDKYSWL
jgi:RNA-directed DNA polymerase